MTNENEKAKDAPKTLEQWLRDRVAHIKGLKAPSEQQQMLVILAEKPVRDEMDERKLTTIIRAEKATDRAAKARQAATKMIRAEHRAAQEAKKKARDHEMFEAAGLMSMAGLLDKVTGKPLLDRAELLGALMGLAAVPADHPKRNEWKQAGAEKLAKEAKPK
ncbi:MAG: hypothetical protein EPN61_05645 [Burkholderiaceae bacterium]|nr:MAG: hypothetical protein EPN61_05645 [Burkholderiaceae bacterium]